MFMLWDKFGESAGTWGPHRNEDNNKPAVPGVYATAVRLRIQLVATSNACVAELKAYGSFAWLALPTALQGLSNPFYPSAALFASFSPGCRHVKSRWNTL